MTLLEVTRNDASEYSCEVTNCHGTSKDHTHLDVRCPPIITQKLHDTKADEGDKNIEFTVSVAAFPKPHIRWFVLKYLQ